MSSSQKWIKHVPAKRRLNAFAPCDVPCSDADDFSSLTPDQEEVLLRGKCYSYCVERLSKVAEDVRNGKEWKCMMDDLSKWLIERPRTAQHIQNQALPLPPQAQQHDAATSASLATSAASTDDLGVFVDEVDEVTSSSGKSSVLPRPPLPPLSTTTSTASNGGGDVRASSYVSPCFTPCAILRSGGTDLGDREVMGEDVLRFYEERNRERPNGSLVVLCPIWGNYAATTRNASTGSRNSLTLKNVMNSVLRTCVSSTASLSAPLKTLASNLKHSVEESSRWRENIMTWYNTLTKTTESNVTVLLVFPNVEAISVQLLEGVLFSVQSLKGSILKVPISLAFILSTATEPALPPTMNHSAKASLSIMHFYSPRSSVICSKIYEQLMVHPTKSLPIMIGSQVTSIIKNCYLEYYGSVSKFLEHICTALSLHFSRSGTFLSLLQLQDFTSGKARLCARCLDWCRGDDDFVRVTGLQRTVKVAEMKKWMKIAVEARFVYQAGLMCWLKVRELVGVAWSNDGPLAIVDICENFSGRSDQFRRELDMVCLAIRGCKTEELVKLLIEVRAIFGLFQRVIESICKSPSATVFGLDGVYGEFRKYMVAIREYIVLFYSVPELFDKPPEGNADRPSLILGRLFTHLTHWFRSFFDVTSSTWISEKAEGSGAGIGGSFNLSNIFLFNHHKEFKKAILGQPRRVVTTAMTKPGLFLKCRDENDACKTIMSDACILYNLFVKSGKVSGSLTKMENGMVESKQASKQTKK